MTDAIDLSVVAYEEDGVWVARAIEHDIAAFADSLPKVLKKFERTVWAELTVNRELGRQGLEGIPAAPDQYRMMFEKAALEVSARPTLPPDTAKASRIRHLRVAEAA